jgi:hypothetical protein
MPDHTTVRDNRVRYWHGAEPTDEDFVLAVLADDLAIFEQAAAQNPDPGLAHLLRETVRAQRARRDAYARLANRKLARPADLAELAVPVLGTRQLRINFGWRVSPSVIADTARLAAIIGRAGPSVTVRSPADVAADAKRRAGKHDAR